MKIGVFPLWAGGQIGGITTYDEELPPALASAAPADQFHVYRPGRPPEGSAAPANLRYHRLVPASRWINVPVSFPLAAAFADLDLIHMTHVPPPLFPKPYVMTLHCFSTFLPGPFYPKLLKLRMNALIRAGLKRARVVICPSQGLRDIAQSELRVEPDRLAVAPHGISPRFSPRPKADSAQLIRGSYRIDRPFLLFVGVMAPRKNGVRIVQAFARFRRETGSDAALVIVGRKWLGEDIDRVIRDEQLDGHVLCTGHVPDDHLPDFYSAAEMLVFPSLWESFGLPVAEAMACGTPVLTSRGSCLPETAAGAALLVDPLAVDDIAAGIARIMNDKGFAASLREKGLERARDFTWRNSALKTLAAYLQALSGCRR